jgi:hypothetical protein
MSHTSASRDFVVGGVTSHAGRATYRPDTTSKGGSCGFRAARILQSLLRMVPKRTSASQHRDGNSRSSLPRRSHIDAIGASACSPCRLVPVT